MKKVLTLFVALFALTYIAKAQSVVFSENFESGMPTGWTQIDANNDNYGWEHSSNPVSYHNSGVDLAGTGHNGSDGYVLSGSYSNATGQAITPNNWLITPAIQLSGAATLSFWVCAQDANYSAEHYGVYISTTDNTSTSSFTLLQEWTIGQNREQTPWVNHTINLSQYDGETVYIAFRHFNCNDEFILNLDDVEITVLTSDPLIVANPSSVNLTSIIGSSSATSITVDGYNLSSAITATTSTPFEVSEDGVTYGYTASLAQAGGTLYVQYSPYATGTESGTITLSSAGATDVTINVTGTALEAAELPYSQNFEDTIENLQWIIENNNSVNGWYIGSAVNATTGGNNALYVSDDNGTSNNYSHTTSTAWAYRDFNFGNHSEYNLSFKVKGVGESGSYDYLKVYLGPPTDVPSTASYTGAVLPGATLLGTYYNYSSWFDVSILIPSSFHGAQRLYLLWWNDSSGGSNPPTAIDDIVITASDCGSTSVPTVSNITAFTADVAWQPAVEEDNTFFVQYVPAGSSWDDADAVFLNVTETTVQLTNLEPNTTYQLRVATDCSGDTSIWKTTSFTTKATCYPPVHVTASQVVGTSAMISWEEATYGANDYTVAYTKTGEDNWISEVVDGTFFMLSNLEPATSYDVMVFSNCDLGTADTIELNFTTNCLVGGDLLIGEGTNTSSYLPEYCLYNYSYTQQIYLASEVGSAADISSIAFNASSINSSATSANRHLKIYLMHTTAATSDWLPATSAQLVYDDTPTLTTGWNTFHFTTPFQYDGISNLAVIVVDETGSWSSSNSFLCHTTEQSLSQYIYQDSAPYSTSSVPSSGSTTSYRNNVIFGVPCDSNATCVSPNVYIADVSEESITVDWAPGYDETAWELEYTSDTEWVNIGSVTAPYELTGLDANTLYYIRVRSNCSNGEYSEWSGTYTRTACSAVDNLPFTENFDDYGTGSTAYPLCWEKIDMVGNNTPYINSTHYQGNGSLYFYSGTTNTYSIAISPEFDASIELNTLQATFMYRATYDGNRLLVGVMSDPEDASTFVLIDTVYPDATDVAEWVEREVNFSEYDGTDAHYIAFKNEYMGTYSYSYIDNLVINTIPECTKPSQLTVSNIDLTSVTLSWTEGDEETEWDIEYGPVGFTHGDDNATVVHATTNPFDLTDLNSATQYDVYVRADCGEGFVSDWTLIPVTFSTTICYTTDQCEYTFIVGDEYGDGWNGGYIVVAQNGIEVATVTAIDHGLFSTQTYDTIQVPLCGDFTTQLIWHEGSYSYEASFTLIGSDGTELMSQSDMSTFSSGALIDTFITNCSGCIAPRNLAYTLSSDATSATITWTSEEEITSWVVEYRASNESDWNSEDISGTPEYTIDNLTAATLYIVRVKSDCGDGQSGYQTITFSTPICDSTDQCVYTLNMTDQYTDGWNGAYLTILQNDIVVATDLTIPSGSNQNTVNLSLCTDLATQMVWHSGNYDNECSYTLLGPDGVAIATHSGMSSYSTGDVVDTFTTNCSGCFAPGNLTASLSADATSATITWTVGNEESAWILEYQVAGASSWEIENISTTPEYTINNLTSATTYLVRVKSDCGDEVSAYQNTSFFTPCDAIVTLPYTENFDSLTTDNESAFPLCWSRPVQYQGYPYAVTAYQHSSPASLRFQSLTTTPTTAVTPQFAEDMQNLQLNFWLKAESTSSSGTFEVGVMTDPNNVSTFVGVWTIQPTSTAWTEYTIRFDTTAVSGTNKYIAFRQHSNSSVYYYWLDDVEVSISGAPVVTDPTVVTNAASAITQTTATLNGTINNPDNVTITACGFEWKAVSDANYIVVTLPNVTNTMSHNLTGLTANTDYTYKAFITFNGSTVYGADMPFSTPEEGQETCNVPTNLTATATAYNTADVTWTAGGSETAWNLQYKAGSGNWSNSIAVTTTNYQLTNLTAETAYQVRVQAVCSSTSSSEWANASFTTPAEPAEPCNVPTGLHVSNITQTTATMSWTAGGNETSWKIGYKLQSESSWHEATVNTTSYNIEGLTANSTYDVRVKAICAADNESEFVTASFTTEPVGIDNITLANSISLMPNPADNYIELRVSSNVEINEAVIYNAFGQMIQTVQLTDNQARIDLSDMAAGMYFVRVNGEGVTATKKFIKK